MTTHQQAAPQRPAILADANQQERTVREACICEFQQYFGQLLAQEINNAEYMLTLAYPSGIDRDVLADPAWPEYLQSFVATSEFGRYTHNWSLQLDYVLGCAVYCEQVEQGQQYYYRAPDFVWDYVRAQLQLLQSGLFNDFCWWNLNQNVFYFLTLMFCLELIVLGNGRIKVAPQEEIDQWIAVYRHWLERNPLLATEPCERLMRRSLERINEEEYFPLRRDMLRCLDTIHGCHLLKRCLY